MFSDGFSTVQDDSPSPKGGSFLASTLGTEVDVPPGGRAKAPRHQGRVLMSSQQHQEKSRAKAVNKSREPKAKPKVQIQAEGHDMHDVEI